MRSLLCYLSLYARAHTLFTRFGVPVNSLAWVLPGDAQGGGVAGEASRGKEDQRVQRDARRSNGGVGNRGLWPHRSGR